MKTKDLLIAITGILISIVLIYLTFKDFDFTNILPILKNMKISFLLLFFASTFLELTFRTLKWYLILLPIKKTEFLKLFEFEIISLGINNILPFRMGEFTKMFLVSKRYFISKITSLSTVFVERLLDTFILFSLFLIYSSAGNIDMRINRSLIIIILLTVIFLVLLFFVYIEKVAKLIFGEVEKKHPKVHQIIVKIKNGGVCFKNLGLTFLIYLSGIVQWNFDVLNNFFIAKSIQIHLIDYFKAALTVFAGSLSASIPSMPGYFGNYEYAISRIMILWGVDRNVAVIYPSIIHILTYLIITSASLFFIYREKNIIKNAIKGFKK